MVAGQSTEQHARATVTLLHRETPLFISSDLWPANSPDLNPVDYKIWGIMQERVYQMLIRDVVQLKQHLIEMWSGVQQKIIDEAIHHHHHNHHPFYDRSFTLAKVV